MTLSVEDKTRIEEEERYRAEVRSKVTGCDKKGGCLPPGCLTLVLVIVGLCIFGAINDKQKTPEERNAESKAREQRTCNDDPIGAFVMAQDFVKKMLKAPSTADFPIGTSDSTIIPLGNCIYQVESYVDSQNSFGAKIRSQYTASVKYLGEGRWSLVEIHISP